MDGHRAAVRSTEFSIGVEALFTSALGLQPGPSSFRVEPNSQNASSSSSPVGMWAGCI